jgi:acyl carrier protein
MSSKSNIEKVVFACVERLNEQLPAESRIKSDLQTVIVGDGASLDSLSMITLLIDIEDNVAAELGIKIKILEEGLAASEGGFRFATINQLVEWIHSVSGGQN